MDGLRARSYQREMVPFSEKERDIRKTVTVPHEILSGWHTVLMFR